MTHNQPLRLRRDVVRAVRAGHPWIYADALVPPPEELPPGAVVEVLDFSGRFLARGLWEPDAPIAVRVFTREPDESIDAALIGARVRAAAGRRAALLSDGTTDACRLVHGEADLLPGIVCDRYADAVVLRFDGAAAATLRPAVVEAVAALPGIREVFERPFERSASRRARPTTHDPRPTTPPREVLEHGLRFEVDLLHGHKTGLYLDQRENRALVRRNAAGRRVLDLFAYTGGFTVAARAGGATDGLAVELSRPALAAARRNLERNGLDAEPDAFFSGDALAWLDSPAAARRTFDLLVIDPPSFAPRRTAVDRALAAYRRLNAAALRLAAPRALVLTCSCSSHIDEPSFRGAVLAGAADARRTATLLESRGAGEDHPVVKWFPEGRYLKALWLEVR